MTRTFDLKPARRTRTPLIIGIVGPSSSGKTKSALRLADGFSRVQPGDIAVIDTEAGRASQHADAHKFLHLPFGEPFGPDDYIGAFETCIRAGVKTIVVDSMSHQWEGSGGVLDMHEAALDKMAGDDWKKRERCTMAAWIKPKAAHNRMKQFVLQQQVNWILCFRAKEKIKPVKGDEPLNLGWQPLGAPDLIYEMLVKILLLPGVDGVPTWTSDKIGERALMKLPGWFRDLFAKPRQLDEDIGEQLARWATGGDDGAPTSAATSRRTTSEAAPHLVLIELLDACDTSELLESTKVEMKARWKSIPEGEARSAVTRAFKAAEERVEEARQKANNA